MFRTNREITLTFGKGSMQYELTVPRHVRCVPADHGEYFVDDLSWIDRKTQGMTLHDATYYGIRLNAADVEAV